MSRSASRDQAEGLRRILASQAPRRFSFLSAITPAQKNAVLLNLAAALVRAGSEVQLLDASQSAQGIASRATPALQTSLWDAAQQGGATELAIREHDQGIRLARLSSQPLKQLSAQTAELENLSRLMNELSPAANVWLVDTDLDADNPFVLPELAQGDIIVLASNTPTSIKQAYTLIKAFHGQFGRRPFSLLVFGASNAQARMIGQNIALAANRYLAVKLTALGSIPADEHLSRAVQLGRAIVDAFPMAQASIAFREIAAQLLNPASPTSRSGADTTATAALEA
jgi:flagellar biosynthesis protein FlhG